MKMNNDVEFTIGEEEYERMFEGIIFFGISTKPVISWVRFNCNISTMNEFTKWHKLYTKMKFS